MKKGKNNMSKMQVKKSKGTIQGEKEIFPM